MQEEVKSPAPPAADGQLLALISGGTSVQWEFELLRFSFTLVGSGGGGRRQLPGGGTGKRGGRGLL